MRAVVVGASVAGVAAAVALREAGFAGEIVLLSDEPHEPYDRPPLSKQLLRGEVEAGGIALPAVARLPGAEVELRRAAALGLDLEARELELADGERLGFDGLVIATGSRPLRLPEQPRAAGLHELRTLDDALGLRTALVAARRVGVVGAGFIGLEVASEARALGAEVTVIDLAPQPLARVFGPDVGGRVRRLHEGHGVEFRCGAAVQGFALESGRVHGIVVDGEPLPFDAVVVGVGAVPATEWLQASGLDLGDGVVCDAGLRAGPGIYAAGDVARWDHPLFGAIRVEHWTSAGENARVAAANLAAELSGGSPGQVADAVPYFWSDQHGVKLQLAGWIRGYDGIAEVEGEGGRAATLFRREGKLVGALGLGWPALVAKQRRQIAAGTDWDEAVAGLRR